MCMSPLLLSIYVGPEKVLVVNSSQTVVEVKPSAGEAIIANMEIKVRNVLHNMAIHIQFNITLSNYI